MASPEALDFLLTRRSMPARMLAPPAPGREELARLLTAAVRVPDHGKLEPWRFVVIEAGGLARFAAAIRARAPELAADADKGARAFEEAPLAVAVVSSPKPSDKIPAIEQTLSAGAVAMSLLNAALAAGWGASWLTGWAAYDRPLVEGFLGLAPGETVVGFVYMGSCATQPPDRPRPDVAALTTRILGVSLIVDLGRALGQLDDPRFLRVLAWAVGLTLLALAAVFWAVVLGVGWLVPGTVTLPLIGQVGFVGGLVSWAAVALMLLLSVVLMVPATAAVVGFFLDNIAAAVEARHYPGLPPVTELGLGQQAVDALRFLGLVVVANLVALVIYLTVPPLAPFVFWLVNGFLLGREYFQLVAMRRLGAAGAEALRRRHFWPIWLAGTAMAVPMSVPILNLVVPIIGVAVFTHQFHRMAKDAVFE